MDTSLEGEQDPRRSHEEWGGSGLPACETLGPPEPLSNGKRQLGSEPQEGLPPLPRPPPAWWPSDISLEEVWSTGRALGAHIPGL